MVYEIWGYDSYVYCMGVAYDRPRVFNYIFRYFDAFLNKKWLSSTVKIRFIDTNYWTVEYVHPGKYYQK